MPKKITLLVIIGVIGFLFFHFDVGSYLTLESLKTNKESLANYYQSHSSLMIGIYFVTYIVTTALSLPGAAILTLAGGAIFGFWTALVVVSFASTMGATCAFLVSRLFLKDWVQSKFSSYLSSFNEGIEKEGAMYLFTLRLVPVFPFFVVNLVMGLFPMAVSTFFIVSQVGMLAGTAAYIYAGTQLARVDSLSGILSPGMLGAFTILGIFPYVAKAILRVIKNRKLYAPYKKPKSFDYNMVVIGGGSAGLVSSLIAAAVRSKVALVEKHKMGGDCLNTGCVPSKALIKSAKIASLQNKASVYGFDKIKMEFNFATVMERVQKVIKKIEPHDSIERFTGLGVECITSHATIISPWEVEVEGATLTTKNIVIATGAGPLVPPFEGLDQIKYYTTDDIWGIREQPKHMVVLGGGPIGSELAQSFCRLGSKVTQIEMSPQILIKEDPEASELVRKRMERDGVQIMTSTKAKSFGKDSEGEFVLVEKDSREEKIYFDVCLFALGRKARVTGFGLENLGIDLSERKTIAVNEFLQTKYPNVYVCGDAAGPFQFTHTAAHQAWYAAVNALFSPFKTYKVNYSVIPWATFTDPEVARVGLNETEAKEKGVDYEVTTYGIDDLDRAIADESDSGFVKVITPRGKDKILGVTIVGTSAGELVTEFVSAMSHGFGLNKILQTIHIYPTMSEANKYAAGVWKKNHKPENVLKWVEKYHKWKRSS